MAASNRSGGGGLSAFTHLKKASQAEWDTLRNEEGVKSLNVNGKPPVYITRRGSIMLHHSYEEGEVARHDIAILHSVRTARQIESLELHGERRDAAAEAAASAASAASAALRRSSRGEVHANTYKAPEFHSVTQGHVVQVRQFVGTAENGFSLLGQSEGLSGKARGNFKNLTELQSAGLPKLSAERQHHSEIDYLASRRGPSARESPRAPDGGVLVHQMIGVNDMCTDCRSALSTMLAPEGGPEFVTYTSREPFNSQGEWERFADPGGNRRNKISAMNSGHIVRSLPENMMEMKNVDRKKEHVDRARDMVSRRNPPRGENPARGEKRGSPDGGFDPPSTGADAAESMPHWRRLNGRMVRRREGITPTTNEGSGPHRGTSIGQIKQSRPPSS